MKRHGWFVFGIAAIAILSAGCTPDARQDLNNAGTDVKSATDKSVAATGQAVENANEKVTEAGKEAVDATKEAGKEAAAATKEAADKAAVATKNAAETTGELVGGAANNVAKGAKQVGAASVITPKVKTALAADKQIDASKLNVDTVEASKQVVIKGTVPSAAVKTHVSEVAKKTLSEMQSPFTVNNQVTVTQ